MLQRESLFEQLLKIWDDNHLDLIPKEYALTPDLAGVPMFRKPLIHVANANDPLFLHMKEPGVVGPEYLTPTEWLPSARSVISVFLPFSYEVLDNGGAAVVGGYPFGPEGPEEYLWPSALWQNARIEGERAIVTWKRLMCNLLRDMGYEALLPFDDPRYKVFEPTHSTWSERHAAYIAGLGTFSLNKGLITEEGMAGRFGSIITSAEIPADVRPYTDIYEYCIRCGACAKACPAHALDASKPIGEAKDKYACGAYLQYIKDYSAAGNDTRRPEDRNLPAPEITCDHFGCSGCQLGMPCERHRPRKMNGLDEVQKKYAVLTSALIEKGLTISTMESCTAGLIASMLTDIDGTSKAMKGSFVTYSNEAKIACGVPAEIIDEYGVYSKETAMEMAKCSRKPYSADIGVGVTGSLGVTDPDNKDSVPGEVYFAIDTDGKTESFLLKVENGGSKFRGKVYAAEKICDELLKIVPFLK